MTKKYQGFPTPYLPGMTESMYHVTMLYMTISTMSITHTRPTLMSPSIPLGGIKKFLQDRPSPKTKGITYMKPITKCYVRIINKAKNIYICYATVPAFPYITFPYSEV